jgi:hypothetical protein
VSSAYCQSLCSRGNSFLATDGAQMKYISVFVGSKKTL